MLDILFACCYESSYTDMGAKRDPIEAVLRRSCDEDTHKKEKTSNKCHENILAVIKNFIVYFLSARCQVK